MNPTFTQAALLLVERQRKKPTPEQIAALAAHLLKSSSNHETAVAEALHLWEESERQIEAWKQRKEASLEEFRESLELQEEDAALRASAPQIELQKALPRNQVQQFIKKVLDKHIPPDDFGKPLPGNESSPLQRQGQPISFDEALLLMLPEFKPRDRKPGLKKILQFHGGVEFIEAGEWLADLEKRTWYREQCAALKPQLDEWWKQQLSQTRADAGRRAHKKNQG